ncbi:MAG: hypothetical protein IPG58_15630 [Acidobacteria bacterium]|nr:hypothetical protein [Acidobacteriota bacterium]
MKTCPQCGQQFSDDNSFCLDDGSILVLPAHTPSRGTGDQPTQVFLTPAPVTTANPNKGILYAFVGVLLLVIGGMTSYIVFRAGDDGEKFQTVSTTKANTQSETPGMANAVNAAVPPAVNASLPPSSRQAPTATGRWSGSWSSPSGAYLDVVFNLIDDGTGRVSGQIDWTLRRTRRTEKMSKIGMSAVEYVKRHLRQRDTKSWSLRASARTTRSAYSNARPIPPYAFPDERRLLSGSGKNGGKVEREYQCRER